MKRLLVVVACVIVALSITAVAQGYNYALTPWPYGVLVSVQTPSMDQQEFIDALRTVIAHYGMPTVIDTTQQTK